MSMSLFAARRRRDEDNQSRSGAIGSLSAPGPLYTRPHLLVCDTVQYCSHDTSMLFQCPKTCFI